MARSRPMRKREQERLTWLISAFVIAHGGRLTEPPAAGTTDRGTTLTPGAAMVLPTVCGPLRVVPHGQWIACRFADVARAVARLNRDPGRSRLNPHSGKWNFDFGAITAEDAFAEFEAEALPLVETHEPSRAA